MQSSHCTLFQGKQHFLLYNIQQSPPTEALEPFKYTELKLPTVSERPIVLVWAAGWKYSGRELKY